MADPLPEMASSCCDKFIVRGDTMEAESSDHTPATDGSTGDTLDCEHASVAPSTNAEGTRRTADLRKEWHPHRTPGRTLEVRACR